MTNSYLFLLETPAEVMSGIFRTLSNDLTIAGFTAKKSPEDRRLILEATAHHLENEEVSIGNKRQLIAYLEALQGTDDLLSDSEKVAIDVILKPWKPAPVEAEKGIIDRFFEALRNLLTRHNYI